MVVKGCDMQKIIDDVNHSINRLTLYLQVDSIEAYGLSVSKLVIVALFSALLLALLAVRGPHLWVRIVTVLILLPAITLSIFVALTDERSHAKPLPMEWLKQEGEIKIFEAKERAPKTIDVFIELKGKSRLFTLPWSKELEKSLKRARGERVARQGNGDMMLRHRFQKSIETEDPPEFYFTPWPAPPSKDDDEKPEEPKPKRPGRDA